MAEPVRLFQLMPDRLESMAGPIRDRLCQDQQIKGLRLAWDVVSGKLQEALRSALDYNVVDIFAECWARAKPVWEVVEAARAGEPCNIELGKHELSRELNPVIAVTIGSCPCIELRFKFVVSAHIRGAQLSIVNGHIASGKLGEAWASARLNYEDIQLHSPAESPKLAIGGSFDFPPPGIAIPGLAWPMQGVAAD